MKNEETNSERRKKKSVAKVMEMQKHTKRTHEWNFKMWKWVFNELEKITDSIYIWNYFSPHNVTPFGIFYGTNAVNHFEFGDLD